MKKKTGWIVLCVLLLLLSLKSVSLADTVAITKNIEVTYRGIQIFVDGKRIYGEEPLLLSHGVVMVPVRTVAEAIGKSVEWDAKKNMVYIGTSTNIPKNTGSTWTGASTQAKQGKITVTYRGIQIYAGGKTIRGEEPFIINDKGIVMVPIRAVAEATGKLVQWDGKKNTIEISAGTSNYNPPKAKEFVWLDEMMVLRNIGPFFRQKEPFSIAAGKHSRGLGVRLTGGTAEMVIRTHGKYKAIEGWLGVDDETANSRGAFFFSVYTDTQEVASNIETEGGAQKIFERIPNEFGFDYNLVDMDKNKDDEDDKNESIYKTDYNVNSNLYERKPVFLSGPIYPASYPKYVSPALTDISGALTVTIRVTWVGESEGDYPDLTAVLADFKFIK